MQARTHVGCSSQTNQQRRPWPAAPGSSATRRLPTNLARREPLRIARATPLELADIPQEAWAAGGAAIIAVAGAIAAAMNQAGQLGFNGAGATGQPEAAAPEVTPLPRSNAVLVFGATGRSGKLIVQELVRGGRTVIAAVRSADKAAEAWSALGLQEGYQADESGETKTDGGILITQAGVDVTDESTLTEELFRGVTQVVSALGGVAGRLPDGSFGYLDGMSPELVEGQGVANVVAAMARFMEPQKMTSDEIMAMRTEEDLAAWERLDDVIMGGSSSSGIRAAEDGTGAVWTGDLIVEGGGFCGARTRKLGLDLSSYDGLKLRVRSDGQSFKFNIKTADQEDTPESTYQATFDTSEEGDWSTAYLPWHSFVPVKRAQSDPQGEPLKGSQISKFGLVLSRFEFNKMPNPRYHPGPFELRIDGGVSAYRAPRPQLVVVSSAGVERNALIGDDAEARKKEIPIIQLNPGGVLNWKYSAECAVRAGGFPYAVVRCTGLDDDGAAPSGKLRLLEADQGDVISGKVSRAEAAAVIAAALESPDAANKTFELRRSEALDAKGKAMTPRMMTRMFLKLAPDAHRWRVGLQPFPRAVPPPAPPSEERKAEILADPRVQEVRDRQQRMKAGVAPGEEQQQEAAATEKPAEKAEDKELVGSNA